MQPLFPLQAWLDPLIGYTCSGRSPAGSCTLGGDAAGAGRAGEVELGQLPSPFSCPKRPNVTLNSEGSVRARVRSGGPDDGIYQGD
jgi:hypothetical protein